MPLIQLTTFIAAHIERVFDLSRSIDLHKEGMQEYKEKAIGRRTSGLIELGESVTWTAKHLGKERRLKVKITALTAPYSFTDEMVTGDFKKLKHEHFFKPCDNGTIMIDQFYYETPYGWFGKAADYLFLESYMRKLLQRRNDVIKEKAESTGWKKYLNN